MRKVSRFPWLVVLMCGLLFRLPASEGDIQEGSCVASYRIEDKVDSQGRENYIIYDQGEITAELDFDKCIRFMKDVPKHKEFRGDKISDILEQISEDQWLIYYYSDNPWPISDSDCVARMYYEVLDEGNTARFSFEADPESHPLQGVERMNHFLLTYIFRKLDSGKVQISFVGQSVPPVRVPRWLIETSFPRVQKDSLRDLVEGITQYEKGTK